MLALDGLAAITGRSFWNIYFKRVHGCGAGDRDGCGLRRPKAKPRCIPTTCSCVANRGPAGSTRRAAIAWGTDGAFLREGGFL